MLQIVAIDGSTRDARFKPPRSKSQQPRRSLAVATKKRRRKTTINMRTPTRKVMSYKHKKCNTRTTKTKITNIHN